MTGEIENIEKIYQQLSVTAVGNSWVICNSKSRPGLKYYFNSSTGQAVWNLSPIEIEKAKKYTKAIPISEIEKCPEPNTEPPMDYTIDPTPNAPSQVFNEQIIRNQCPIPIPNMLSLNMLNNVPAISGYNPNVWNNPPKNAVPAPQVIYVAYQPPVNFRPAHEYPQHVPPTNYQNHIFDAHQGYSQNIHSNINKMFNRGSNTLSRTINNNRSKFSQNVQSKQMRNFKSSDLRQKLTRKRSKSLSYDKEIKDKVSYQEINTYNENKSAQRNTQESPSKYDLSVLKQFKPSHSKANNWFIVVDTEVILNNFPFLNKISDPDQNCYLMVPHNVMSELQQLASSDNDVRSRRIYRFLSAHIDSELAFKGEDMTDVVDNDTEKIFATCVEAAIRNNVILLSNDVKFQAYKNNKHNFTVLTLNELKTMLNEPIKEVPTRKKSPTLGIKIVVPNDREFERNEAVPSNRVRPKTPEVEVTPHVVKNKEIRPQQSDFPTASSKRTPNTQPAGDLEKHLDEVDTPVINTPESIGVEKGLENLSFYNKEKKKEIKLRRNNSNQKTIPEVSTQTKQFRWRKQRRTNEPSIFFKSSAVSATSDQAVNVEDNKPHETPITCEKPSNFEVVSPKNAISPPHSPSIDRSSVSSHYKRLQRPNVENEETSTSGVISITTMDCESVNSDIKKTISVCEDVNYEVFQIVGQDMEEVLRIRREEWVLRFVQIMEEVLREQLRDDSPFQSKDYAPPWATDLPELARCIIKKFSDHFNVVDAANRLSFTLQRISDRKGNVSANIEPGQYMDMYSFGVYLIQSLKSVNKDCEDLNIADESLKKLLYDIQNGNLDYSHNDCFADDLNESTALTKHAERPPQVFTDNGSIRSAGEEDLNERRSSNSSYMLRSRKKTPTKIHNEPQSSLTPQNKSTPQKVSTPQRISTPQEDTSMHVEKTFFSSLELSKRLNTNNTSFVKTLDFEDTPHSTPNRKNITQTSPRVPLSPKTPSLPDKQSRVDDTSVKQTVANNKDALSGANDVDNTTGTGDGSKDTDPTVKTCFVRNFTSIAQFEKKLLCEQSDSEDRDDDLNDARVAELKDGETIDNPKTEEAVSTEGNLIHSDIDNNKKFRYFIMEFVGGINESFEAVRKLCAEFVEELKNSQESRPDMIAKLRAACAAMLKISNYLNSILDRESRRPESNVMLLLKKANLEDFVPNEELRLEYADIISKCRDQAFSCYKTVTLIMKTAAIKKIA